MVMAGMIVVYVIRIHSTTAARVYLQSTILVVAERRRLGISIGKETPPLRHARYSACVSVFVWMRAIE